MSPTVFMVCTQFKILTSALFAFCMLNKKITRRQYVALILLPTGMICVEKVKDTGSNTPKTLKNGILFVLAATCISGFVGAYLEKIYKDHFKIRKRSLWSRNVQLATFSVPMSFCTMYWRDGREIASVGLFHGYDAVVITLVVLHAAGGLIVAMVVKHASNVMKCFAVAISICACELISVFYWNSNYHTERVIGILIVVLATYMYTKEEITNNTR